MRQREIVEFLRGVPLFAECTARDLQTVARHGERLHVEAGKDLVTEGNEGSAFYMLLEGTAVVRRNGRKVGELGTGDFVGELALLDPAPRNATVTTTSDVVALALTERMFNVMVRDLPGLRRGMLTGLAGRLRALDRQLAVL